MSTQKIVLKENNLTKVGNSRTIASEVWADKTVTFYIDSQWEGTRDNKPVKTTKSGAHGVWLKEKDSNVQVWYNLEQLVIEIMKMPLDSRKKIVTKSGADGDKDITVTIGDKSLLLVGEFDAKGKCTSVNMASSQGTGSDDEE
jgi:hypothetical protein